MANAPVDRQSAPISFAPNAIQMRHSRLVECSLKTNPNFPPVELGQIPVLDSYPISVQTMFGPMPREAGLALYQGRMTVELADVASDAEKSSSGKAAPPYFFKFVAEGVFQCMKKDAPDLDTLAAIHGSAALMGLIREMLAQLTSRASHGMVLLPSIVWGIRREDAQKHAAPAQAPKKKRRRVAT